MTVTDRYAVFGQPINHSKSPRIHALFAEQTNQALTYSAQEVSPANFTQAADAFFDQGGKGLNCTVPLKELAFAYAHHKTDRAECSKAVNTLAKQADGSILGDNTDGVGLVTDLTANHGISLAGKSVLILGAGGATRGIIAPLMDLAPQALVIANRTVDKAVQLAALFGVNSMLTGCGFTDLSGRQFDVVINATSASLSGDLPDLPGNILAPGGTAYDLAYANKPTAFVRWGRENGAIKSLDGLGMLVEQAAQAFYIWRGVRPQTQPVIDLLNAERQAA